MAGLQHHFVTGIRARREVEYAAADGRPQRLHIEQSEDELCGPMALAQAAMLLCGWPRAAIANPATRHEPMRTFWRRAMAFQNAGTSEADLSMLAAFLAPAIEFEVVKTANAIRVGSLADDAIGDGHVPLVRYTTHRFSHWCAVVGMERTETGTSSALLALDTDIAAPSWTFYNCRIDLQPIRHRRFPHAVQSTAGDLWHARLDSVCVVRRGLGSTR